MTGRRGMLNVLKDKKAKTITLNNCSIVLLIFSSLSAASFAADYLLGFICLSHLCVIDLSE